MQQLQQVKASTSRSRKSLWKLKTFSRRSRRSTCILLSSEAVGKVANMLKAFCDFLDGLQDYCRCLGLFPHDP